MAKGGKCLREGATFSISLVVATLVLLQSFLPVLGNSHANNGVARARSLVEAPPNGWSPAQLAYICVGMLVAVYMILYLRFSFRRSKSKVFHVNGAPDKNINGLYYSTEHLSDGKVVYELENLAAHLYCDPSDHKWKLRTRKNVVTWSEFERLEGEECTHPPAIMKNVQPKPEANADAGYFPALKLDNKAGEISDEMMVDQCPSPVESLDTKGAKVSLVNSPTEVKSCEIDEAAHKMVEQCSDLPIVKPDAGAELKKPAAKKKRMSRAVKVEL